MRTARTFAAALAPVALFAAAAGAQQPTKPPNSNEPPAASATPPLPALPAPATELSVPPAQDVPPAATGTPAAEGNPAAGTVHPESSWSWPIAKKVDRRNGWYFHLAGGFGGLVRSTLHPNGNNAPAASASVLGGSLDLHVAVGHSVVGGLALGGLAYLTDFAGPGVSFATGDSLPAGKLTVVGIGPFADWYPSAWDGVHLQAGVGYSRLTAESCSGPSCNVNNNLLEDYSGNGVTFTAGLGIDGWASSTFSLGLLARFQYMTGSMTDSSGFKLDWQAPTFVVMLTGTLWK